MRTINKKLKAIIVDIFRKQGLEDEADTLHECDGWYTDGACIYTIDSGNPTPGNHYLYWNDRPDNCKK